MTIERVRKEVVLVASDTGVYVAAGEHPYHRAVTEQLVGIPTAEPAAVITVAIAWRCNEQVSAGASIL
jgi:hypothetical protein